ncbi:MAG: hypothetical protein K2X93_25500 [Candidatus Obscuribacterales bacterium]|nr:hypothetical protein [Candidatus Obscuribacterales bacterium]
MRSAKKRITTVKFDRRFTLATLSAALFVSSSGLAAQADDSKSSSDAIDTKFSVQYINSKAGKKADKQCLAVYKVLDVIQIPEMQTQIMPGDVLELAYSCDDKQAPTGGGSQPWAELKSDGMVAVHIPNKCVRIRAHTSAENIWRIDNKDNQMAVVKPKDK